MGLFGWLEKKEVPPDIEMIHREVKESRRREEALRKVVVKQARDISKLQHDVRVLQNSLNNSSSGDLFKPPKGDRRSIWEYVFGKRGGE